MCICIWTNNYQHKPTKIKEHQQIWKTKTKRINKYQRTSSTKTYKYLLANINVKNINEYQQVLTKTNQHI